MAADASGPRRESSGAWVPVPDPTTLTTAQLRRELENLRDLIFARFNAIDAERAAMRVEMERYRTAAREYNDVKIDKVNEASIGRHAHLEASVREQFIRIEQHFDDFDKSTLRQFESQTKIMELSLTSAKEAVAKAETANEKRFDNVNEFRKQLSDQAASFLPRREYEAVHQQLLDRVNGMSRVLDVVVGQKEGHVQVWGFVIGAAGVIIAALTVGVAMMRHT